MKKVKYIYILILFALLLTSCKNCERNVYGCLFGQDFTTISFDSNGGSYMTETRHVKKGCLVDKPHTPVKIGYVFAGWYLDDHLWDFEKDKPIYDLTLKAKWEPMVLTVTLDTNGGNETYDDLKIAFGSRYSLPTPTKEGYAFVKWKDGNLNIASSKVWYYTENKTFTAEWANEYIKICFITNDPEQIINPLTLKYGEIYTLPKLKKEGYKFLGWYNGEQKIYEINSDVKNDIVVEVKWEIEL